MRRVQLAFLCAVLACTGGKPTPGTEEDAAGPERDARERDNRAPGPDTAMTGPADTASPDVPAPDGADAPDLGAPATTDARDAADTVPDLAPDVAPLPPLPFSCDLCAAYAPPRAAGSITAAALGELSGVAASRVHAGVYYANNDDDDRVAQVFTIDRTGAVLGQFVADAEARKIDTEEVAVAPCPGRAGSCIYLADAGDGGARQPQPRRTEYALYVMPEPASPRAMAQTPLPSRRFRFAYPDGSHDSEAMLVDPADATVYLITKVRSGATTAYALPNPLVPDALNMARKVRDLPIAPDVEVTAASAHPCGVGALVRTYGYVYELRGARNAPFVDLFAAKPTRWATPLGDRAEAITYESDGRGYLTIREGIGARVIAAGCQ